MKTFKIVEVSFIAGIAVAVCSLEGCSKHAVSVAPVAVTQPHIPLARLTELRPVKDLALQYYPPELPVGPGQQEFEIHCVVCHSPRYVLNQPVLPRKTWKSEVHKMVVAYGATIAPPDEAKIVDYVVSWHGKEDAPEVTVPVAK